MPEGRVTVVAEGFTLLESPRWHDGALWTSDFYSHRVLRFTMASTGSTEPDTVCIVEGRPSGLGFMPDGELRICSMLDNRLLAWNGAKHEVVADFTGLVTGPSNDLTIDSAGNAFVGNFGLDPQSNAEVARPTSLLRVTPDGTVAVAADDVVFPNGMAIDERSGLFFLAETFRARVSVWRYSAGELSDRCTWVEFEADTGEYPIPRLETTLPVLPDGIALDCEGLLWLADAKGHGASRVAADGSIVDFIETGASVYAVALGGPDGRDLFLCCAPPAGTWNRLGAPRSALMRARVDVPAP